MEWRLNHVGQMAQSVQDYSREFEKITKEYEKMVNAEVTSVTIHSDLNLRMEILKKTI